MYWTAGILPSREAQIDVLKTDTDVSALESGRGGRKVYRFALNYRPMADQRLL